MSRAEKLLDRMRRNPRGDWTIGDVETVCRRHGVECCAPKRGSHYDVSHPSMSTILTIPARRPIKAIYIEQLVEFIDAVTERKISERS